MVGEDAAEDAESDVLGDDDEVAIWKPNLFILDETFKSISDV